jgi:hypothetical protein
MKIKTEMVTFGGVMAMILSWTLNHSIGLMFLHGLIGWIYVIYYWFVYYHK